MLQRTNLIWLLGTLLLVRIIAMAVVPLADTTEPRYAEIARLMLTTNDWITPWFEPGVPFWGKPPLSFWAQALSFKLFGINARYLQLFYIGCAARPWWDGAADKAGQNQAQSCSELLHQRPQRQHCGSLTVFNASM